MSTITCTNHNNQEVIFIKVNEIIGSENLFYCESCVYEGGDFKPSNFVRVKSLLENQSGQLLQNWPPIGREIQEKLKKYTNVTQLQESQNKFYEDINTIFSDLKSEIAKELDEKHREVCTYQDKIQILGELANTTLNEISQVDQFKKYLLSDSTDQNALKQSCRNFIMSTYEKKEEYTTQVSKAILKIESTLVNDVSINLLREKKQQIIANIKSLQLFGKDLIDSLQFVYYNPNNCNEMPKHLKNIRTFEGLLVCTIPNFGVSSTHISNISLKTNKRYSLRFSVSANTKEPTRDSKLFIGLNFASFQLNFNENNQVCLGESLKMRNFMLGAASQLPIYDYTQPVNYENNNKEFQIVIDITHQQYFLTNGNQTLTFKSFSFAQHSSSPTFHLGLVAEAYSGDLQVNITSLMES